MRRIRIIVLVLLISAAGFFSWLYLSKKPVENIPRRATLVMNNLNERDIYEN